ncbi:Sphingolipid long chain base-responsive protein LSP1 [Cytospora mali]|uniref:Sphingolipid long chain base-responsive protein LSP1 n=1 Tax=Cytospora mali TaxID=578113 RepID=A0A194VR77_CYTMA|nr:Sphingolipid long chain base-responsive protein LSP1 [Valsa mali]
MNEWSNRSSDQSYTRPSYNMNRSLSIRSKNANSSGNTGTSGASSSHHRVGFSLSSLRGSIQPELSRKLYKLIKTTNNLISAHETAGKERISIASQLSEWGEQTNDEAISDVSDKVGVIMSELGEQEDTYAHALDDARGVLKQIRNTEKSVQPTRDGKRKITDEIAKLKSKEPESARLPVLEQELVRAEAENLVAEAQLTNVTREKLKESYDAEFLATIERAEKQIILARHGRRLLHLLDDTPVVPGDQRHPYAHAGQARQILNDAEDDLRDWQPESDDHQHEEAGHGQKQPAQLQSPTSSGFGEQSTQEPASDDIYAPSGHAGHVVETTPGQNSQGEYESVEWMRGCGGGDPSVGEVSVVDGVILGHHRAVVDAKTETQSATQQQLEESPTVVTGSPVSSVGGWRQHGNQLEQKQQGLVF